MNPMSHHEPITVAKNDDGLRLEVWLAQNIEGLSRHKAIEAIREGLVFVDGRKAKKGIRVASGQTIDTRPSRNPNADSRLRGNEKWGSGNDKGGGETKPEVLFSNVKLVVVNKPAGMPCHALRLGETGTLLQWVGERFPEVLKAGKDIREGGLLHRLDTDTSGAVAFARDRKTFDEFRPRFVEGSIEKTYLAVVSDGGQNCGQNGGTKRCTCCAGFSRDETYHPLPHIGKNITVKTPLGRHPSDAGRMVALIDGDERHKGPALSAKTTIRTLAKGNDCALVEATIERGRMHQIRLHLASIGHPIIGDKTYGGANRGSNRGADCGIERQALHAYRLTIDDIKAVAPLPDDFRRLCEKKDLRLPNAIS